MLADMNTLDLTAVHAVRQTAGLLSALRLVLRQITCPPPSLLVIPGELLDVELCAPAHGPAPSSSGTFTLTVSAVALSASSSSCTVNLWSGGRTSPPR
jgi:hypothetical protein